MLDVLLEVLKGLGILVGFATIWVVVGCSMEHDFRSWIADWCRGVGRSISGFMRRL